MTNDKTITVAVPEDRVAEFYAFYARFLAGHRPGRRGGWGPGGPGHHRPGHAHCGSRHPDQQHPAPAREL